MKTLIESLIQVFLDSALRAFPQLEGTSFPIEVEKSSQGTFGHYQFNSAMKLAKSLQLPPREIAQKIVGQISQNHMIAKLEIAGPGFVNITLNPLFLTEGVEYMLLSPHLGVPFPQKKQRIIVEFSSPNTAKELHVGHLRSTIIGDSLARLLEFLGHDVLRLNHVGDWGTAFGMLIAYMKEHVPEVLAGEKKADLEQLVEWYKASKRDFDTHLAFKKASQLEVVALQSGDPESLKGWHIICAISRNAYEKIYELLEVSLLERGESYYNPTLEETVDDLDQKGLITVSDGAKCLFLEGFLNREGNPLPLMVQKSDGGYNYDTTDMAAMRQRVAVEKADRIIIVTDAGQSGHFAMVAQASVKAGYLDPNITQFDHVPFGLVLGPDGKKFKTRSGETVKLLDLLIEAEERALAVIEERNPEMEWEEKKNLAHVLGIGAVKYADLSCHRTSDYSFSYDRMLRFEGNTAPFLLYAYVRIEGIKRKADLDIELLKQKGRIGLLHPSEIALGLHLLQFAETLNVIARDLTPNRLTDYLYALAEKFNAFFRDCQVVGTPEQDSRLLLCELTGSVLKQGLTILGLKTVTRM